MTLWKPSESSEFDPVVRVWKKWIDVYERGAASISEALVDLAGLAEGHHVLDIATGAGEPALTAARAVGSSGHVIATDVAPEMLQVGRERAAQADLTNVEFHLMDATRPDLSEGSFDAILCRWGLMFLPDLEQALRRLGALLVAGGRLAAAVWSSRDRVPLIATRLRVLERVIGDPGAAAFSLADPAHLEAILSRAGFGRVSNHRHLAPFEFASADDYVAFQREVVGPYIPGLVALPPERQGKLWEQVAEAARRHATPSGRVPMPSEAICVVAEHEHETAPART